MDDKKHDDIAASLERRIKLDELTTEYAAVLSLDAVYFGPKTKQAIVELVKYDPEWWNAPDEPRKALVNALVEEYNEGVKGLQELP